MRRAARVDTNQAAIVTALRAIGASVESLAPLGDGIPDLLVGFRGRNYLLEVKTTVGQLNNDQVEWHDTWRGSVCVVRSVDGAIRAIGAEAQ